MIDALMARFEQIPGARVGRGIEHPASPDASEAGRLTEFLSSYRFLRADSSYEEFLMKYGGAYIENEEATQIIDILGFSDVSTDIIEMDGSIVSGDGYLVFAQCIYHIVSERGLEDTQEHDFAFDATGERKPGVYGLYGDSHQEHNEFEWRYDNFADWLADLVAQDAKLSPPAPK
ncbi:hypothetical protein AB0J40_08670 [Amycolatopsis sp. NPDC049691]|uniref:hypothetical protein n=1 Tax=Amycolatopsis sp. NPDC049691 TaxID=3155155 RepID=UPI00344AEBC3